MKKYNAHFPSRFWPAIFLLLATYTNAQAQVVANAGPDQTICLGQCTTLTASGGTQFNWSTGSATQSINVCPPTTTTYTVIVSNGADSDTDQVTVFVNSTVANAGPDQTICLGQSVTLTASGGGSYTWSTFQTTQSITVSPSVTTTYHATVTNNGCVDTDQVTVFVNSAIANAGPDQTICPGQCATLTASGGTQFNWMTGSATQSITVCPSVTTTYSVWVTNNGCVDTDQVTVFVGENTYHDLRFAKPMVKCGNFCTTFQIRATGETGCQPLAVGAYHIPMLISGIGPEASISYHPTNFQPDACNYYTEPELETYASSLGIIILSADNPTVTSTPPCSLIGTSWTDFGELCIAIENDSVPIGITDATAILGVISLDPLGIFHPVTETRQPFVGDTIPGILPILLPPTLPSCDSLPCFEPNDTIKAQFATQPPHQNDTLRLCTGQPVQFIDQSEGAVWQNWQFGDGGGSPDPSATHIYQNPGTYQVWQKVQNACGSPDSASIIALVNEGYVPEIYCTSSVCPGQSAYYHTDPVCGNYEWTVTGAVSWSGQGQHYIEVEWGGGPEGSISLATSGCGLDCNVISSAHIPIVQADADIQGPNELCEFEIATYELPKYENTVYNWTISPPDAGYFVEGANSHQATVAWFGAATAQLHASYQNKLLGCGGAGSLTVSLKPKPSIAGPANVCQGGEAVYEGALGEYSWSIVGNSGFAPEDGQSVMVEWDFPPGSYTLRGSPTNPSLFCLPQDEMEVNVAPPPPPPSVSGAETVCAGQPYTYGIGNLLPYNNPEAAVQNGIIIAQSPQEVTVVWDDTGNARILSVRQVGAEPLACESEWTELAVALPAGLEISGPAEVCVDEAAAYTAPPLPEGAYYEWSVEPDAAGSITEGQGEDAVTVQWNTVPGSGTLQVQACGLQADFQVELLALPEPEINTSGILCVGTEITLSAGGTYSSYEWRNEQNQTIGNAQTIDIGQGGVYTLRVSDQNGCFGTAMAEVDALPFPLSGIHREGSTYICTQEPHNVTLYALANENYTYEWHVNGLPAGIDEPIIMHEGTDQEGTFLYELLISNQWGCEAGLGNGVTITQLECPTGGGGGGNPCVPPDCGIPPPTGTPCTIDPTASVQAIAGGELCGEYEFSANTTGDATSLRWNFGDGSPSATTLPNETVTHNFTQIGIYNVAVMAFYPSLTADYDSCFIYDYIDAVQPLQADFAQFGSCAGDSTSFHNLSVHLPTTQITAMQWDFGDGSPAVSGIGDAMHVYDAPGSYEVTLALGNDTCYSTITKTIVVYGQPDASFGTPGTLCLGEPLLPVVANPDLVLFGWDFGDGNTSKNPAPSNGYAEPGMYTVTLNATDLHGCAGTYQGEVEVLPPDTAGGVTVAGNPFCPGSAATLTAPSGTGWLWSGGATAQTIDTSQPGRHYVTVTDANGCTFTAKSPILSSHQLPPTNLSPPVLAYDICGEDSLTFTCNNNSEAYTYAWSNGTTGGLSGIGLAGTESVSELWVLVTDPATGCSDTSETIVVYNHPVPETPVVEGELSICEGESTTLTAVHPDAGNVVWSNGHTGASITTGAPGFFTASYTSPDGCTAASPAAEVRVHPFPDVCVFPQGCHNLCEGDTLCVPDLFAGYQWLLNGNPLNSEDRHFIVPGQAGDYSLELTSNFGCQRSTETVNINLANCTECNLGLTELGYECVTEGCSYTITATYLIENGTPPVEISGTGFEGVVFDNIFTITGLEPKSIVELSLSDAAGCVYEYAPDELIYCPDTYNFGVYDTAYCLDNGQYELYLTLYGGWGPFYIGGDLTDTLYDSGDLLIPGLVSGIPYNYTVVDSFTNCAVEVNSTVICGEPVLPVELINYSGIVTPEGNLLQWTTGAEINSAYFDLHFSKNGTDFINLAHIQAAGTSSVGKSYQFLDDNASSGLTYYRLTQTDVDGTSKNLGTITLVRGNNAGGGILSGSVLKEGNLLRWETIAGASTAHYDLHFSQNGTTFQHLAELPTSGNPGEPYTYEYLHQNAPEGLTYYQLTHTPENGTTNLLETLVLFRKDDPEASMKLHPSPARKWIAISLDSPTTGPYKGEIYDPSGRVLQSFQFDATFGLNNHEVDLDRLPPGIYLLRLISEWHTLSAKFVKR